jgi:hypothetical protein
MCKFKTKDWGCSLCTIKHWWALYTPDCHEKTCITVKRTFTDALLDELNEKWHQSLPDLKKKFPVEEILAGAKTQGYK